MCEHLAVSHQTVCPLDVRYLDAVLDGEAGERVHPGNLMLKVVVVVGGGAA